jgi:hypothetical protein
MTNTNRYRSAIDALDEILYIDEPISNALSDRDVQDFIGPVAVYVVHSANRSFGAYAGAYRSPLTKDDLDDIREWTEADVSGPFASHSLAMDAIKPRPSQSACYRFTVHPARSIK